MGIRRNILHSYSLIFIFLLLAMAKLVNFNEILNKFIDFLCWKIKFIDYSCIYWCSSVFKIYNSVGFFNKNDIFYRINLFFCEKEGDFWAFFGGFF
jgi:hypothetical protein